MNKNPEQQRLDETNQSEIPWKKWGPYLSERQWGTVREDFSKDGNAWEDFSHDQARSRAYHWGEDGLAGISDDRQRLCFSLALWNGHDSILKERIFGLTNNEGNHGEDAKEYYYYLDSTPTHSYLKYLYKYPHASFPYDDLVTTNRQRGRHEAEYELIDTGVFDENRYFDVVVEYAKASAEDILIQISVHNRGPEPAEIHLLPTLWFRNRWSWGDDNSRPRLDQVDAGTVRSMEEKLGEYYLHCEGEAALLFTENETNSERLFGTPNSTPFVKDGINSFVVHGKQDAVNPQQSGTKVAAHYHRTVPAGKQVTVRLRLRKASTAGTDNDAFGQQFAEMLEIRRNESDAFFASIIPPALAPEARNVVRQALAGMMWTKQFYYYDVNRWLEERGADPFCTNRKSAPRNERWHHLYNADVVSMPDKWEYPWYAAWDLAFHVLPISLIDPAFAKQQLEFLLRETCMHPNGQIPAYEWNFGDTNPPVHAWATIYTYRLEKARTGEGDIPWLERSFQKLLLNFTWWMNRVDRNGRNAFEGGFLGLDNIGVFDRSSPLPTGGYLEQADGTAWMAIFSLNMLEISIELAMHRPAYAEMVPKFAQHFCAIASATIHAGGNTGMWDEEDGFFYDVLQLPDGSAQRLKVRSMVGLLPLCAVTVFEGEFIEKFPGLMERIQGYFGARPELTNFIHDPRLTGHRGRRLGAILDETKLRRVLATMLDENEFFSPHGIRSLSRHHANHPYVLHAAGQNYQVGYVPGESDTGMFGGNSNWRGPVWMPVNALIIRALLQYYDFYGNDFTIECPTGSGNFLTLHDVAGEISRRLASIFLPDENGNRPVHGEAVPFQKDSWWRDYIPFYEYFHGDTGQGLGASHQTGWTGLVAQGLHLFATITPEQDLADGKSAYFQKQTSIE